MGQYFSLEKQYSLEDSQPNKIPISKKYRITDWDYSEPKNFDYYFNKERLTKISRSHYKNDYKDGWLWGRTEINNIIDSNIDGKEKQFNYYLERLSENQGETRTF